MARVLMLGGTRFLGPHIVGHLLGAGHEVALFHRGEHEPSEARGAKHIHGDFAEFAAHVPHLSETKPEVVIDVVPYLDKAGHGVQHFRGLADRAVVVTSGDVYRAFAILHGVEPSHPPQPMPLTERSETRTGRSPDLTPEIDYDNVEVEQALAGDSMLPVTILRLPVVYGPRDPQRRLAHYVRRMVDGRRAILLDERLARFRWSRGYVENVAAAVALAATDVRARGRTYNVAERDTPPWRDWVHAIADICRWKGEIIARPAQELPVSLHFPVPPGQDFYFSSRRLRKELGYNEPIDPTEGLRRAVEWERKQERDEPAPDYSDEDAVLASL